MRRLPLPALAGPELVPTRLAFARLVPALLVPALLALGLPAFLAVAPAAAQGVGRSAPPPSSGPATRPPPPALPGLANRRAVEPIPAETPGINLPPNDALFDAVNRGDLGAAREAMGRGADLNARNQLGLTPIDAAVDQGRNEIAFYLLSARGSAGSGPTSAPSEPAPAPAARRGRNAREAAPPREAAAEAAEGNPFARASAPEARGAARAPAPAPTRARLFAGDGGTPRPEIGFIGFDAGRPPGAEPLPGAQDPERPSPRRGRRG